MIITRTPFRVSFAGGGTDLKDFFKVEPGAVTSTAINKYMYIIVNKAFGQTVRVSYSKTEIVERADQLQHPIVREALKLVGIDHGIEIVSVADIPSGLGLGSSSSFAVGLLNALYAYKGILRSEEELAREACRIEIDILGEPIGKQDQYIAAYGGLKHFTFNPDDSVSVSPILCPLSYLEELTKNLQLFRIGEAREARIVLSEQRVGMTKETNMLALRKMRDIAKQVRQYFQSGAELDRFGRLLHESWVLKKQLATNISFAMLDNYYEMALSAGALGGKLLGAGAGGFLLLYSPQQCHTRVQSALKELKMVPFSLEKEGSRIIHVG